MSAAPPKEKSMMDKLSEGISSAFNTAGTEANKAKLQTEIAMKQHQIKGIKQEFGVAAWDLMARDDTAGLQALFKQRQATAQNVIGDLGKLQRQLADLGGPKPTHVVSVTVPAGAKEGESIEAKASDGSTVRITVPAGTSPGATLHVRVPVALPPPVDPTVPVAQGTPVVTTTAEPVEPAK
mmetsp:Transcript_13804/g.39666  ORF Transcript_13804/g.39666 Transcript_13804/m.39666 type:complete len:181 (+) Transcript_13804:113-655(+)